MGIYNEVAEGSDQYQATPRPLQRKVREKMCTSRTSRNNTGPGQQNNNGEEFRWQGGLYPDLSGLFGAERGERSSGEEAQTQGRHCRCHQQQQQPDLIPIILSKCCQFSLQMTKHMVRVASPLVLLLTIFLMPRSIIYSAVFMMLSAALGLHMPTLMAGQMLYALLSMTDPFLMTFICMFAIHKTVIRKKPLIDLNYWKGRIAGMENCRMN